MKQTIKVKASRFLDRDLLHDYLEEVLDLPNHYGRNLDALYDCLSEIGEETDFIFTKDAMMTILSSDYAYRVLRVFGKASEANPNIHILFRP